MPHVSGPLNKLLLVTAGPWVPVALSKNRNKYKSFLALLHRRFDVDLPKVNPILL